MLKKSTFLTPFWKPVLVREREARDNNQTCKHVSPHAAEWRSLQLLVAVCRILSMCIRVSVCIWTCLHVFACICTYVRVPARICAYLRVSARICEYLPAFARILCVFAPLCLYLRVFVHICKNRWKSCQNAPKKSSKTTPKNAGCAPPGWPPCFRPFLGYHLWVHFLSILGSILGPVWKPTNR